MSFLSLLGIEFRKLRRSRILFILLLPVAILWLPSILNARVNLTPAAAAISPEYNFLIQGYMGMAWFMIPATFIICTVLLTQTERKNNGILKMLALPLDPGRLCLAKFVVLLSFGVIQLLMTAAAYYISAAAATHLLNYPFILPLSYVLPITGEIYLASLPMAAVFWMLATLIRTPVFSIGIGLAAIVPSVLMINTKIWFAYPMCYPFYTLMTEYGRLSPGIFSACLRPLPLIPAAAAVTVLCLTVSCIQFGHSERSE